MNEHDGIVNAQTFRCQTIELAFMNFVSWGYSYLKFPTVQQNYRKRKNRDKYEALIPFPSIPFLLYTRGNKGWQRAQAP